MNLVNGRAFKPSDWSTVGLPIVRIQNLNDRSAPFNHCAFEVDPKHRLRSGDFLISWSGTPGTSFGAFIWTGPDGVLNQHIFRAELYGGCYEPEFLRVVINARLDEMIARAHGAVGLQHITKGELEHLPIPLPPLPEQKRIVAKVDELMKLIDDLEARQTKATATQSRFRTSALDALTKADGPAQLAVAWKRVAGNFEVLFEQAESVAGLRRVVRDLAVVGRVVEQRTGEGDGRELLPQLHRDVEAAGGKWSDPRSDEIAAETGAWIPPSWAWVRLATVATFGPRNGYSPKAVDYPTAVKTLTLTATTSGRFKPEHVKYIDEEVAPESDLWLREGDILIQRSNSIDYVGMAAVFHGPGNTFIYPDLMMKVRLSSGLDIDFAHLVLLSTPTRHFYRARATGTAGSMPKINQAVVSATPIPLPPLAEQKRIVAKVEALMKLCDDLEAKLKTKEATASRLVEAVVRELVA